MKKQLIIYAALLSSLFVYSQGEVILASAYTGGSVTACSKVSLKPGFSYKATAGKNIGLKVSPSTCDPFDGKDVDATAINGENYIRTKTYLKEDQTRYLDQIQYFDGLGRPIQTVQRGITPGAKDLATYQEYDPVGRESLAWLPGIIDGNNGKFVKKSVVADKSIITNADTRPYTEPIYEPSPLNRITAQIGPGEAWRSSPAKTEYLTNNQTALLSCLLYTVRGTRQAPTLSSPTKYATGELYVTKVTDEDNNPSYKFKDKLGQVVLTRQVASGVNYDTYYVYDDYGNLCFVIPPLAAGKYDGATLGLYAYQYQYNNRNLCIAKKLPGCDWVRYIYDKADRLILTQDGEQATEGKWLFSIPDAFGRVVLTGILTNKGIDYKSNPLQNVVVKGEWKNTNDFLKGYGVQNLSLLQANTTILTVNYYDDYEFLGRTEYSKLTDTPQAGFDSKYSNNKTLLTGTATALLDGTGKFLYSALYYDKKGQLIQTKSTNHLDEGYEDEYIAYNFTGQPIKKMHIHKAQGKATQTETYTYEYDHAGRLINTRHKLNTGNEVLLASNKYDNLGRLQSTTSNGNSALSTTYTYQVRSWTKSISNTHFTENLDYTLNGNIGIQSWLQNGKSRSYTFKYNGLSMLTEAKYTGDGNFSTYYTYDKHGNVESLKRYGIQAAGKNDQLIEELTFNYGGTGNQLKYVSNALPNVTLSTSAGFKEHSKVTTAEYTYNKNGAMLTDLNKGQRVIYNMLNLPQEMLINNPSAKGKNYYTYTATGTKLRVRHLSDPILPLDPVVGTSNDNKYKTPSTTDYVGNKIYENGVLNKILIDNGYIEGNNYYFYIKDHLGNNRIVANAAGGVVQRNSYYPFGMSYGEESDVEQGKQNLKYNGKELDKTHGLNQYDYEARYMDPATVRFTSVDPLAEKKAWLSPYIYCSNNPINRIDPDGRDDYYSSLNGKFLGSDKGPGTQLRMMDDDEFNRVNQNNDLIQFKKMQALEQGSTIITVDTEQIKTDMQTIADLSFGDNKQEQQINIILDRNTATITSVIGAPGTNSNSPLTYYEGRATGASLADGPNGDRQILIGNVHTHPKSTQANRITEKTMSTDYDRIQAIRLQIPIYGIDAMDAISAGTSVNFHRVDPAGNINNRIGTTRGRFNIGRNALELWGRSGSPTY